MKTNIDRTWMVLYTLSFILFFLPGNVSSSNEEKCEIKYSTCASSFTSLRHIMRTKDKTQICNSVLTALECMTDATEECNPEYMSIFEDYEDVATDACSTDPETQEKWIRMFMCIGDNFDVLKDCMSKTLDLPGQPLCNATEVSIKCNIHKMGTMCSPYAKSTMEKLLRPISDQCENVIGTGIVVPSKVCITGISNCNYDMHNCKGIEETASCILNVLPSCVKNVEDYIPITIPVLQSYVQQIPEYCDPESPIRKEWSRMFTCLRNNIKVGTECILTALLNLPEQPLCNVIDASIKCYIPQIETICGPYESSTLGMLLPQISDQCENVIGTEIVVQNRACTAGISKCNFNIQNCKDIYKTASCILKALPFCNKNVEEFIPLLHDYIQQIPEYCNPESPIRKNLDKSFKCMLGRQSEIAFCYQTYVEDLIFVAMSISEWNEETEEELDKEIIRASMKVINCYIDSLSSICGKEAEFSLQYMLQPMKDFAKSFMYGIKV